MKPTRISIFSILVTIALILFISFNSIIGTIALFADTLHRKDEIRKFHQPFIDETNENKLSNFVNEGIRINENIDIIDTRNNKLKITDITSDSLKLYVYIPSDFDKINKFLDYCYKKESIQPIIIANKNFFGKIANKNYQVYYINMNTFYTKNQNPIFFLLNKELKTYNTFTAYTNRLNYNDWYFLALQKKF